MPGLGTSLGRGGATTTQQDLANSDAILIMGSSMAENHPVGFQWVMKAREGGAKVIHVDPRFTRTSAAADYWLPLRAGSDIVFLGGMIHYVVQNERIFRDYVVPYTNASTILRADFRDTEDLAGLFSGWDAGESKYQPESWLYQGSPSNSNKPGHQESAGGHAKDRGGEAAQLQFHQNDPTLQHPRCVYQVLKKHFSRYTPEMVERVCGIPQAHFLRVAETFVASSGPEKTAAICYAVGWTQHSTGVQIIRSAAILQLLLGNIGRPGGGILALRGHASIQGSTDIPTLYDILPGYLPMPAAGVNSAREYCRLHKSETGGWANLDKYLVSLLKAYYGETASPGNDFGFGWLPRITGDHSHLGYWLDMADGKMTGLFVMGQNPAVGAPNSRLERKAMARLKWMVVRDMVETETASFWRQSPEITRGELRSEDIATEVFMMPAAGHVEKAGTYTNTQRLLQFHEQAIEPPGDARSESWFVYHLGRRLKAKASADPSSKNAALNALTWNYPTHGRIAEPQVLAVVKEINGYTVAEGKLVSGFADLKADGSTACGCWIYSGVYPQEGMNRANQREPRGEYGHGWGFAWPADRRILYNRASARPDGRPWSERKKLVWWDEAGKQWTGKDNVDFTRDKAPGYKPSANAKGDDAIAGDQPFIMHPDGVGWIWVASGLKDGPLPTHYEPLESPFMNALYPWQAINPAAEKKERPDNPYARAHGDPRYPHVLTTYRLTEHHTAGGMSRQLPHLAELQPELFCEVSPQLGRNAGLTHGEWATIVTPRGAVEARVMMTSRMQDLTVLGQTVHHIGLPYHFGYQGLVRGDVVNDLLAISEEPNVRIMESKALVCDIRPGRVAAQIVAGLDVEAQSASRIAGEMEGTTP